MRHPPETLQGERLRLRRSSPADAARVFALVDDPDVMRFLDWPRHDDVDGVRRFLHDVRGAWDAGREFHWVIEARPDGQALGCLSFRVQGTTGDLGYLLGRAAWGRGLAAEASGVVLAWAREEGTLERVVASCDVENVASARVLERLGLVEEAVLPARTLRPNLGGGPPRDTRVFGLRLR